MSHRRPLVIAAIAVPAVGVAAAALAAGTTPDASTPRTPFAVQCLNPSAKVVVPPAALYNKVYTGVGTAGVSGTLPAIPAVGPINSSLLSVQVTVQYFSGSTGTATLRLPGHEYHIPVQFTNPPQTKSLLLGPKSASTFQVFVTGKATARVTVSEFLGSGTQPQAHLVAGTSCAPGETVNAVVDPAAPTPASSPSTSPSPGSTPSPSTSPSPFPSPLPIP